MIINGNVIELVQGDITKETVDAIVNAANSQLAGGGGVDGAIHRAGGPSIMANLNKLNAGKKGCPTGSAVITGAGNLKAKYVIHAVGPRYRDGNQGEPQLLESAYRTSLEIAAEQPDVQTMAFPSISTGIYSFPVDSAAEIALNTVASFLSSNAQIKLVRFVLFDSGTMNAFQRALEKVASRVS